MQLSSSALILCYFLQHREYPESEFPVDYIPCNAHTLAHCESGNYSSYAKSLKMTQTEERKSHRYRKTNQYRLFTLIFKQIDIKGLLTMLNNSDILK